MAAGKEPCMENCKEGEVKIINRAAVLDVTPEEQAEAGKGAVD
jgi:NADH:ubiquinone oxidoreductase subunit E